MNKQPSRIGLYLVLIIALVAGYFYLNNQVVSQSNYTQKQLEQALEDNKVVDAAIQQNREVPTGSVIVDTTDSGQKKVYVTDVNQAIELLNKYDIDITTQDVPGDNVFLTTLLPVLLTGALVIFLIMMMNRQMAGGGGGGNAVILEHIFLRQQVSVLPGILPDEPDLAVRGVLLLVVGGYPDIGGGNFQITGGHGVSPFTVPESGTGVANSNTKTAIMQSKRRRHLESR